MLRLRRLRCLKPPRARWKSTKPQTTSSIVIRQPPGDRPLTLGFGKLARFADGSCVASQGQTSVLVTVVSAPSAPVNSPGFLPLTVDYRQKAAAFGRIPTNFLRRDMGATDVEILASRVIDRSLRPLFPKGYCNETQIVANLLAVDGANDPVVLALNAASAGLSRSSVPWNGPVGAVRVGMVSGQFILNPTRQVLHSDANRLNLVVAGTHDGQTVMLEAEAKIVDPPMFKDAISFGLEHCADIAQSIRQETSDVVKRSVTALKNNEPLEKDLELFCHQKLKAVYSDVSLKKIPRDKAAFAIRDAAFNELSFEHSDRSVLNEAFSQLSRKIVAELAFDQGLRVDGRHQDDLREIHCEVDLHRPLHGSALFQRGETQVFCTVALDSPDSALKTDAISALSGGVKEKNFFLHYEFPQYATNDIGRTSGAGRRELGHGALAEKALKAVVPKNHPFTIRLSSEVLESNGSSSMATICGGTMALMDAGVPLKSPAAGVAIGLVSRPDASGGQDYKVLVDILGLEDYLGDMDFKLAGTREGITALQADIKIPGLPFKVVEEALKKGHDGIGRIIDIMDDCISQPKLEKPNWPVKSTLVVPVHKRGRFLGPGGINLKRLLINTGVQVTPDPQGGESWNIFAPNQEAMDEGMEIIDKILAEEKVPELEFGAIYPAKIKEIRDRGIFVELHSEIPNAFIPNSQLDARKVHHPSALGLTEGQDIQVKYYGRDPVSGAMRLSRKALTVSAASAVKQLRQSTSTKSDDEDFNLRGKKWHRPGHVEAQRSREDIYENCLLGIPKPEVSSEESPSLDEEDPDDDVSSSSSSKELNDLYYKLDGYLNDLVSIQMEINESRERLGLIEEQIRQTKKRFAFLKDTSFTNRMLADVFLQDVQGKFQKLLASKKAIVENLRTLEIQLKKVEFQANKAKTLVFSGLTRPKSG